MRCKFRFKFKFRCSYIYNKVKQTLNMMIEFSLVFSVYRFMYIYMGKRKPKLVRHELPESKFLF